MENKVLKDPDDPNNWVLFMEVTTLQNVEPNVIIDDISKFPNIEHIEIAS